MARPEGERTIEYKPQDAFAAAYLGTALGPLKISEQKIKAFCGGCDNLRPDNTCYTQEDQARYAARLQCGWAQVKGVRGNMVIDGFIPSRNSNP